HISPNERDSAPGDTAAFVGNLDRNVFLALRDHDLYRREVLLIRTVCLDNGSQTVLEGLEKHVRQVARDVHEGQVRLTDQLDLRRVEQAVVIFADEACIVDGFLRQF